MPWWPAILNGEFVIDPGQSPRAYGPMRLIGAKSYQGVSVWRRWCMTGEAHSVMLEVRW